MQEQKDEQKKQSETVAGAVLNHGNVADVYSQNVLFQSKQGHGIAAEYGNHHEDIRQGKRALHLGGDNARNGADRRVNGVFIQTKYCQTAARSIDACFDSSGTWRYVTNKKPMQIEVPKGQYNEAVEALAKRIREGKLKGLGVTNPAHAKKYVREGHLTYEQAKNIARFGTIDGLKYDSRNGIELSASAASISAAITYARAIWSGENQEEALKAACYTGLTVCGTAFVTHVATQQLGKSAVEHALRPATDFVVQKVLGPSTTKWILTNLGTASAAKLTGQAAQNHLSKLMRGNTVAIAVTSIVLSAGDFARLFQGRISGGQAFKNIGTTTASVVGGAGGASVGAAAGASLGAAIGSAIPGAGTAVGLAVGKFIGGFVGGLVGGGAAGAATSATLGAFIEDDAPQMLAIVNETFGKLAEEYLLSELEAEASIGAFQRLDIVERLRDMYASQDRHAFSISLITPLIEHEVKKRPKVSLPSSDDLVRGIHAIVDPLVEEEKRLRKEKIWRVVKWSGTIGVISFLLAVIGQHEGKKNDALPVTPPPQVVVSPSPDDKKVDINQLAPPVVAPKIEAPASSEVRSSKVDPNVISDVTEETAYKNLYGEQEAPVVSQYIFAGASIPFVQGVYPFAGTEGQRYRIAFGVSRSSEDSQLYIDAQVYKAVDGGWLPYAKVLGLDRVVLERVPVGQPSPINVISAEGGVVTMGLRLDHFTKNGQSSSARMLLLRFSEGGKKLYFLKPSTSKSGNDGELLKPRAAVIGDRTGYVFEEKNPRFQVEQFYFDDAVSYVCDILRDPETGNVRRDSCKEKNLPISR